MKVMRVLVLRKARKDLEWWSDYYEAAFPQGRENATQQLEKAVEILALNPHISSPVEGFDLRKMPIHKTQFVLIYRVRKSCIEIVRVWDARKQPTPGFQEEQALIAP
jgi:plasmid stabilization system protein ParE